MSGSWWPKGGRIPTYKELINIHFQFLPPLHLLLLLLQVLKRVLSVQDPGLLKPGLLQEVDLSWDEITHTQTGALPSSIVKQIVRQSSLVIAWKSTSSLYISQTSQSRPLSCISRMTWSNSLYMLVPSRVSTLSKFSLLVGQSLPLCMGLSEVKK